MQVGEIHTHTASPTYSNKTKKKKLYLFKNKTMKISGIMSVENKFET